MPSHSLHHYSISRPELKEQTRDNAVELPLSNQDSQNAKDHGRIACARCRRLKIKCIFDEDSEVCKRCHSSNSECAEAVSTRKQLKRKGSDRVAQLESTVNELQSTIRQMKDHQASPPLAEKTMESNSMVSPPTRTLQSESSGQSSAFAWSDKASLSTTSSILNPSPFSANNFPCDTGGIDDLIKSKIVTQAELTNLFEKMRASLIVSPTGIRIPENVSYWDLYQHRPILLQTLITIASSADPVLYPVLWARMRNRLLSEFFTNNTRRIDLIQGFLLSVEYFTPQDNTPLWMSHAYAPLATEVALDLNMFSAPTQRHEDALDELEYERTLVWLNTTYCAILANNNRHPQRVIWTEYHHTCIAKLLSSNTTDRQQSILSAIPRIIVEIQDCGPQITSLAVLKSFSRRIRIMESDLGRPTTARTNISILGLEMALHENYVRFVGAEAMRTDQQNTQLVISDSLCKDLAIKMLQQVECLNGELYIYPSYFYLKPIHALIIICKIYRHLKAPDDGWALMFANRIDAVMAAHARRGSALGHYMSGKAASVMRWWQEATDAKMEDSTFQVMQWTDKRKEVEKLELESDFDFQTFAELFNIAP